MGSIVEMYTDVREQRKAADQANTAWLEEKLQCIAKHIGELQKDPVAGPQLEASFSPSGFLRSRTKKIRLARQTSNQGTYLDSGIDLNITLMGRNSLPRIEVVYWGPGGKKVIRRWNELDQPAQDKIVSLTDRHTLVEAVVGGFFVSR